MANAFPWVVINFVVWIVRNFGSYCERVSLGPTCSSRSLPIRPLIGVGGFHGGSQFGQQIDGDLILHKSSPFQFRKRPNLQLEG
jgi:hypothetical protein